MNFHCGFNDVVSDVSVKHAFYSSVSSLSSVVESLRGGVDKQTENRI